jgi:hypothetical protein
MNIFKLGNLKGALRMFIAALIPHSLNFIKDNNIDDRVQSVINDIIRTENETERTQSIFETAVYKFKDRKIDTKDREVSIFEQFVYNFEQENDHD